MKNLIVLMAFLSLACSGEDKVKDIPCTEEARAGLVVKINDAESGEVLTEGVTVTAVDENYSEMLHNFPEFSQDFTGAYERAGNYTLTVTKEGYVDFITETITVGEDVCHVITQNVTVELQPED